jgi:uncharacterized tellurite resistance protein B-like protein
MLDRIRDFFIERGAEAPSAGRHPDEDLRLATAAMLVEAARMDEAIGAAERERIQELLAWRFGLPAAEARTLFQEGVRATEGHASWHGFTQTIRAAFDEGERLRLVEMLWEVVLADGRLHDLEASLMRRVAGLLNVPDADSGAARKRVVGRHGLDERPRRP